MPIGYEAGMIWNDAVGWHWPPSNSPIIDGERMRDVVRPLTAKEKEKVKEVAWVVCNVSDCGGTKAKPCTRHYEAAERLWRDVTSSIKS